MVKLFAKWRAIYRSWRLYRKCERAKKHAQQQARITGKKQLVLMYDGAPVVVSKQHLKRQIACGAFARSFTIQQAEQGAIYVAVRNPMPECS